MSEENVEIVRRFWDLYREGRWSNLDLLSEDLIYRPTPEMPETGEYRGREGYRRYLEGFFNEDWSQDLTAKPTSFRDCGDRVIVRVEFSGHGRASGLDLTGRVFQVFTLRDGEIVRIEDFIQRSKALEAAGVAE
jgi:ketosteroid isomerase-like protein